MRKLNLYFFEDEDVEVADQLLFYGTIGILFLCTISMIAGVISF